MSTNPLRKTDRILQQKSEVGDLKQSITLFDIDYAMMSYLENTVLPTLDDNGKALKIPVIYGNSPRWNAARKEGIYRDAKGKLQLPLMMIRRTSIAKDESMPMVKRAVSYSGVTKYSKDNRYDRFSLLGNTATPKYERYDILMPEYIELNYECMGWTSYIEHLNSVIESVNYTGEYWGDKDKFKFRTNITDYNVVNEVGDEMERINRVEFTLNVKAYLLPETFDGQSPIRKSTTIKRTVFSTEVDMTSGTGRLEGLLTTPSPYYDNKDLIDFLSINNNENQHPTSTNTITFSNIKLIKTPASLAGVVSAGLTSGSDSYDIKVYINGVRYYPTTHFTFTISSTSLTLNFISGNLGFNVTPTDEVIITGKFINL
jgi:hypothetical protein